MLGLVQTKLTAAMVAHAALPELARVKNWGESSFINLPMIYPSGSAVTVKVDLVSGGIRISDNGFAFQELEAIGAGRSFGRVAKTFADVEELLVGKHTIYVDVAPDQVVRAICDVAMASWRVADHVFKRNADEEEEELEEHLRRRLPAIFADRFDPKERRIHGASRTEWPVSALVRTDSGLVVFNAVSNHPVSINQVSTSFMDLSNLDQAPRLVGVVRQKSEFGSRLVLLSEAGGRVIEEAQPDAAYVRAAA
jgi:hypothetical protein